VKVLVVLAVIVASGLIIRSRKRVEVWHVAEDQPS
jgi:hypothetical protein